MIDEGEPLGPPRWVWRTLVAIALTLAILVVITAVVVGVATINRTHRIADVQAQIRHSERHQDCVSDLTVELIVASLDAQSAPPGSQQRADATSRLLSVGTKLRQLDRYC